MPTPHTTVGITVVPMLDAKGQPCAVVTITGTTADSVTAVDANGAEIALETSGTVHVSDYRGADALEG